MCKPWLQTGMTTFASTMASKEGITSAVSRAFTAQKDAFDSMVETRLSGHKGEIDVKMTEPINAEARVLRMRDQPECVCRTQVDGSSTP